MFRRKTVFVIGAGASADLKFPLGDGLRHDISRYMSFGAGPLHTAPPPELMNAIIHEAGPTAQAWNPYFAAANKISLHLPYARSIDEFVDHHRESSQISFLSKAAICKTILDAERNSSLIKQHNGQDVVNHPALEERDAWLKQAWYMMREDTEVSRPIDVFKNVSFVVFNYDRCLEKFLTCALRDMYELDESKAAHLVANAPIIHPYGQVAPLSGGGAWSYGENNDPPLQRLSQNIRTYCESGNDEGEAARLNQYLTEAESIVIIGFAFRKLNLELLKSTGKGSLRIFATAKGIPNENWEGIGNRVQGFFKRERGVVHSQFRGVAGAELLRTFESSLI